MASKKKRTQRTTAIVGSVIGLVLVFTFVLSLLNLDVTSNSSSDDVTYATVTPLGSPAPVVPPTPEPDPQLDGGQPYVHSSGYFQTFLPGGSDWVVDEGISNSDAALVRVVVQSGERLALFHNFIIPGVEYDSPESLSTGYLTSDYFGEAWNAYTSWTETARVVEDDHVTVDFEVVADNNTYLARAVHTLRDGWLYVTRIVVPANNPVLFERLTGWVATGFQPFTQVQTLPVDWPTFVDHELGYVVKYPSGWSLVAGGAGRPVTFDPAEGGDQGTIRTWGEASPPPVSVEEARAWVEQSQTGVTVLDAVPFERADSSGFEVSYNFRDTAGDQHSGLIVIVSGVDQFFVANAQIDSPGVNLISSEGLSGVALDVRQAVTDGFFALP